MTRGGRVKARGEPERRCIVTRESRAEGGADPLRASGPDGEIVPDLAGTPAGPRHLGQRRRRGAGAGGGQGALRPRARRRRCGCRRTWPSGSRRCSRARLVELLALARKAGQAVAGLEKTKAALVSGEAALLLQAADGSARERGQPAPAGGRKHPCFVPFRARIGFGIRPGSCDTCRRAGGWTCGPGARRGPAAVGHQGCDGPATPSGTRPATGLAGEGPRGKG